MNGYAARQDEEVLADAQARHAWVDTVRRSRDIANFSSDGEPVVERDRMDLSRPS